MKNIKIIISALTVIFFLLTLSSSAFATLVKSTSNYCVGATPTNCFVGGIANMGSGVTGAVGGQELTSIVDLGQELASIADRQKENISDKCKVKTRNMKLFLFSKGRILTKANFESVCPIILNLENDGIPLMKLEISRVIKWFIFLYAQSINFHNL